MDRQLPFAVELALGSLEAHQHDYGILPLRDSLEAYRDVGMPVGGFLTALLSNDLLGATGQADATNLWLLPVYASFLYNEMPSPSHGSREKVDEWLAMHRARREQKVTT